MKAIAKYAKPFLFGLIMAVMLLFVQAICDLNLPNYMSDIVNVGIQQNGIEHAAPDAISADGLRLITTFMPEEDRQLVNDYYSATEAFDAGLYPNADGELYLRGETDAETLDRLDTAFGTATWTFINTMRMMAEGSEQTADAETTLDVESIDLSELYALQPMLDNLPEEALQDAHERALANDEAILKQSGIVMAEIFYRELGIDVAEVQSSYILRIGLTMLAIALVGGIATVSVSLLSSRVAAGFSRNLRKAVFSKIESFSSSEFDKFSTASLITRCTNDVMQVQMTLMMGIRMICYAPIMGIGGIVMAVSKSPSMSWMTAVICVVLIGFVMIIMAVAMPKFKIMQKLVDRLNLVSRENLSGQMVIRAFGTQEHEEGRFRDANSELSKTNLFVNRVMSLMSPFMMLIMNVMTLLIVWVGAHQIANSGLQVGDMMAFMQYAMHILMSFLMISMMFIFLPRAAVSADRIAEVLNTELTINDPETESEPEPVKLGTVEFRDVHFQYSGAEEEALSAISFTAQPGQTTAIIGSTGSGKSTMVNLLLRFYDVTAGQIYVDGADIREMTQRRLRSKIGYVPQKGVLLSGTIASNLRYGNREATDGELVTAAAVAQAQDFIEQRDDKFDAEIAQGGSNVSGGQKQRLSIARALAKKPEIFIFDDSFSALDFKTDAALRKALKEHTGDSTVIVVAQRVSTILSAEQILVLDQGRIVGKGTHKELLKSCPEYYEIASSQLAKEELE